MSKYIKLLLVIAILYSTIGNLSAQVYSYSVMSPDKKIEVIFSLNNECAYYRVLFVGREVLQQSKLGIVREDEDFSQSLSLTNASPVSLVTDRYITKNAKRSVNNYKANKRVFNLRSSTGKKLDITFQVSNDGVAFRYYFAESTTDVKRITKEITSFRFPDTAKAWLQPMSIPKSGWEKTNPSYEENYLQEIPVGTSSPLNYGWVYPALFKSNNTWMLITEASLDSSFCGTRLSNDSASNDYTVSYPGLLEVFTGKGANPQSTLPWHSPWRVIALGSLQTIIQSTLGTDLAKPAIKFDDAFVKPGKASWSWINSKDNRIVYSEQKKYIDFAADMKWQYCLIDVNWDTKIGYDSIKILADYAKQKNVGLILWYNSSGDWNTTKYHPKSKLLTAEDRAKEFSRIRSMGIKGIKVDFFSGDGQSTIKYYLDILNDAGKYQLLVNFHGATLTRGWQRTYPHLLTAEAVKGFEMVTFDQRAANVQANHCAMLPFTRNAFDPMDFTPMNLFRIPSGVKRRTTSAFELATSVVFLSGIQHFAESPEGMANVPEYVKNFLRKLPVSWEDVRFIDGFPGKLFIIARKSGTKWYVAGINGEASEKNLELDLLFLKNKKGQWIVDGPGEELFSQKEMAVPSTGKVSITMKPNGGFAAVF